MYSWESFRQIDKPLGMGVSYALKYFIVSLASLYLASKLSCVHMEPICFKPLTAIVIIFQHIAIGVVRSVVLLLRSVGQPSVWLY